MAGRLGALVAKGDPLILAAQIGVERWQYDLWYQRHLSRLPTA
jgi:hypothetical protein